MINVTSYHKPEALDDAINLMASSEFTPIAGGTDIIPQLRHGQPRQLLDISDLGLSFIKERVNLIEIGAAITHSRLNSDPMIKEMLPLVSWATGLVGSWQIRNRGTVGGNIVNASPCADSVPALLNYDVDIVLVSKRGKRSIKLAEFITKPYQTQRNPDELLHSIKCKKADKSAGFSYIKLGRRQAVNISRMTLAVTLAKDENNIIKKATIAAGSVFPAPALMPEIEKMLVGEMASSPLFEQAANLAAELMIKESGFRWSTPYKQPVLVGLIQRALGEASGLVAK
jgi:CO/xanthine dehydrogenase FAD-binding subunit